MTLTEIKKEIYKQQPIAYFQFIRLGVAYYYGVIKGEEVVDAVKSFGDYFDSFVYGNDTIADNFQDILTFKRTFPEIVVEIENDKFVQFC